MTHWTQGVTILNLVLNSPAFSTLHGGSDNASQIVLTIIIFVLGGSISESHRERYRGEGGLRCAKRESQWVKTVNIPLALMGILALGFAHA